MNSLAPVRVEVDLDIFDPSEPIAVDDVRRWLGNAREAQREADAALVAAKGCARLSGCGHGLAPESHPMGYGALIEIHDPRCPIALAAEVQKQGGGKEVPARLDEGFIDPGLEGAP